MAGSSLVKPGHDEREQEIYPLFPSNALRSAT